MKTSVGIAGSEAYLAAVRDELDDLPEEDRADLIEDLAQHLAEVTASLGADDPTLETLLGTPDRYAAELRAAAGLPPRSAPKAGREPFTIRFQKLALVRLIRKLRIHPIVVAVTEFLPQLRPAWWVARGYLVVAIPALWSPNSFNDFPVPTINGSHILGFTLTLATIGASVVFGTWSRNGRARPLVYLGNLVLASFALLLLTGTESRLPRSSVVYVANPVPSYELQSPHGPVTNIFPYSASGAPLEDVLLFDQDGRPLRTAMQQWWPDACGRVVAYPRAADGVDVTFSYPKEYVVGEVKPGQVCQAGNRPEVPLPHFGEAGQGATGSTEEVPANTARPTEIP